MKRAARFLLLGLCAAVIAVGILVQREKPPEQVALEKIKEFLLEQSGTIDVSGTVVDHDGNPLHDVEVNVAETDPFDMMGNLRNRKKKKFDHRFRIKRYEVSSIDCTFIKWGHYSERRSFSFSREPGVQPNELVESNIVIVLREKPESAPLEKYEGFPRSNISGPTSVLYTRKLPLSDTPLTPEQRKERKRLNLSRPHIFLEPAVDSNGRLARVPFDKEGIGGIQTVLREGRMRLSHPDPGDGFFEADLPRLSSLTSVLFREMTEAPATGYEPQLVISTESSEDERFFYCRIHGEYGKGFVNNLPIIFADDAGVEYVGIKIIIFLNPTGSRDVSFLHI